VRSRVLFVDDEPDFLAAVRTELRREYEVHVAGSGEEGLAALQAHGPFDVVISDMRMPGMDGAEFLRRSVRIAPDSVRILLTGHSDQESAIGAVNEGRISKYLTKPLPASRLRGELREAVLEYRRRCQLTEYSAHLLGEIQAVQRLQREILDNVSHELRTPLTIIRGSCELLQTSAFGAISEPQSELLQAIDEASLRLGRLIESSLEGSPFAESADPPPDTSISYSGLVRALKSACADVSPVDGVTFRWEVRPAPEEVITTNLVLLAVVARNLIENACKFTQQGAVAAVVELDSGELRLSVEDTGIGIPTTARERVFDRFRQSDSLSTSRFCGGGLGLYVVRQAVDRLGGTIAVESGTDRGTCFRLSIPQTRAAAAA